MSFQDKSDAFRGWLDENDISVSQKIDIVDMRAEGQGRAVVASQDIDTNDLLFKIPKLLCFTVSSSSLLEEHPEIRDKLLSLGLWEALTLAILYEWKVKNHNSRWAAYFDILPFKDTNNYKFNQLIFWTEEQAALLSPSLVLDRIGRESAREMYQGLLGEDNFGIEEFKNVSLQEFDHVALTIMSYSFNVETLKEGEDKLDEEDEENEEDEVEEEEEEQQHQQPFLECMVPLADVLNADSRKNNARLMYEAETLEMRATEPIKKGDQIYNIYSNHCNSELLRRYGYVEPEGSDQDFGVVPLKTIKKYFAENTSLSLETVEDVVTVLKMIEQEEEEEIIPDDFAIFVEGEIEFQFTFVVQLFIVVAGINDQRSFNFASLDVKARGLRRVYKKCYQLLQAFKVTSSFVNIYKKIIQLRMADYPKRAAVDLVLKHGELSREEMAAVVLRSEYKALQSGLDFDSTYKNRPEGYTVVDDQKLLKNILKKDIFEGRDEKPHKRQKVN